MTGSRHLTGRQGRIVAVMLIGVLWAMASHCLAAWPATDRVVYLEGTSNQAFNEHFSRLLQAELGEEVTIQPFQPDRARSTPDIPVVTLGPNAFSVVRQESDQSPILALLVDQTFIGHYTDRSDPNISAIFYDAPLLRQALVGRVILPHATRVAVLAQPDQVSRYEKLFDDLRQFDLEGKVFVVGSNDNLISTLVRALNYGDFLLAAPDDRIYNPRTIKHILLTAYRRNRLVIGPSQGYVKAGALASTYTPLTSLAENAAHYLRQFDKQGHFPPASYPESFAVEINRQVARSLNIPVPPADQLKEQLLERLNEFEEAAP